MYKIIMFTESLIECITCECIFQIQALTRNKNKHEKVKNLMFRVFKLKRSSKTLLVKQKMADKASLPKDFNFGSTHINLPEILPFEFPINIIILYMSVIIFGRS